MLKRVIEHLGNPFDMASVQNKYSELLQVIDFSCYVHFKSQQAQRATVKGSKCYILIFLSGSSIHGILEFNSISSWKGPVRIIESNSLLLDRWRTT